MRLSGNVSHEHRGSWVIISFLEFFFFFGSYIDAVNIIYLKLKLLFKYQNINKICMKQFVSFLNFYTYKYM